jgi:putative Holliday junction resolvase
VNESGGTTHGRVLAVDYGSERIGLALSDPLQIIAGGAGVLQNGESAASEIGNIAAENAVVKIIVGMPYLHDGAKGGKAKEVDAFIARLQKVVTIPVEAQDESFTSVRAKKAHLDGGMKKKDRREKGRVDEMAARLLLQDYLDSLTGPRPRGTAD